MSEMLRVADAGEVERAGDRDRNSLVLGNLNRGGITPTIV